MNVPVWQIAPPSSALPELHSHVWLWNIETEQVLPLEDLSEDEASIAKQFIFRDDRAKYVRAHTTMRRILATYLECLPRDIELTQGRFGKPVLAGIAEEIHFSLSHASAYAVLAVAHSPLGVDLEQPRLIDPSVAAMYFSHSEQKQLATYTGREWIECFFRCWTRKEAVLKAEGVGLTLPLDSFDVEIAHDKQPAVLAYRDDVHFSCDWKLHDVSPSPEVIVALAAHPKVQTIQLFSFEEKFLA